MQVIYGVNPVMETILGGSLKVEKIILAQGKKGRETEHIIKLAERKKITVEFNDRSYINKITGGAAHQGIICICPDYRYAGVDEVIANRHEGLRDGLVLILDGIKDPHNLGSIIRTGYCLGINGIIIPEDRAASVTPTVMKTSAGAAQHVPIARVVNISRAIDYLKERGFWIYGADASSDKDLGSFDYRGHTGLVIGSEGKGIRPLVRKKCDFLISIAMTGTFNSLNVSVATGIILYEMSLKREKY